MAEPAELVRVLAGFAGVPANGGKVFNWTEIEREVGLQLPADYKLLAEQFPAGWFRRFVRPIKPVQPSAGAQRLLDDLETRQLETLREWRAQGSGEFPFPLYPEPGGLLPWGSVRGQGYAFWLTDKSSPGDWPVVLASQQCDHWERFDGPVCEFLIEVAAARYDATGFTEGPIRAVTGGSGNVQKSAPPIILADRPVFESDSAPAAVPGGTTFAPPGFWRDMVSDLGGRRPVNEMPALRALIGKPATRPSAVDWERMQAGLGFRLPADYREFIDTYGPGTFGDIRVTAPGAPAEVDMLALMARKYKQVRGIAQIGITPPFCPEPGGTVCWGETAEGWVCGWAPTSPDPDEWTVAWILANPQIRAVNVRPGVSFSSMLREHAQPGESTYGLVPLRDPAAGPVTFTPYTP